MAKNYGEGRNVAAPMPDLNPTSTSQITGTTGLNMTGATVQANNDDLNNIVGALRGLTTTLQSAGNLTQAVKRNSDARDTAEKGLLKADAQDQAESFDEALQGGYIDPVGADGKKTSNIEEQMLNKLDAAYEANGSIGIADAATTLATQQAEMIAKSMNLSPEKAALYVNDYQLKASDSIRRYYDSRREATRENLAPGYRNFLVNSPMKELRTLGIRRGQGIGGLSNHLDTSIEWRGARDDKIKLVEDALVQSIAQGDLERAGLFVGMLKIEDASIGQAAQNKYDSAFQQRNETLSRRSIEGFANGSLEAMTPDDIRTIQAAVEGNPGFSTAFETGLKSIDGLDAKERLTSLQMTLDENGNRMFSQTSEEHRAIRMAIKNLPTEAEMLAEANALSDSNLATAGKLSAMMANDGKLTDDYEVPFPYPESGMPGEQVTPDNYQRFLIHQFGAEDGSLAYNDYKRLFASEPKDESISDTFYAGTRKQIMDATNPDDIANIREQAQDAKADGLLTNSAYEKLLTELDTGTKSVRLQNSSLVVDMERAFVKQMFLEATGRAAPDEAYEINAGSLNAVVMKDKNGNPLDSTFIASVENGRMALRQQWKDWLNDGIALEESRDGSLVRMTDSDKKPIYIRNLTGNDYQIQLDIQSKSMRKNWGQSAGTSFDTPLKDSETFLQRSLTAGGVN